MSGFSLDSPLRFLQAAASPGSSERDVKSALSRDLLAVASMDEAEVLAHLGSSLEGLNCAETAARLARRRSKPHRAKWRAGRTERIY